MEENHVTFDTLERNKKKESEFWKNGVCEFWEKGQDFKWIFKKGD